jgi:predicted nucleic acid-binding protein
MLIDSSVWLEIFLGGKHKDSCEKMLNSKSVVSVLSYYEVYKKLKLIFSEQIALEAVGSLSSYQRVEVTQEILLHAADIAIEYDLAMADSILLAQAKTYNWILLTLDNDFSKVPGVQVIR